MSKIIDTNRRTTGVLGCLRGEGVTSIVRYYARTTQQPEKRLTRTEAEAIVEAGLSILTVHQAGGNGSQAFSAEHGRLDASYSLKYAREIIGQPDGSALYFAVDFDCDASQLRDNVLPHFQAIRTVLQAEDPARRFRVGAYGNGLVLDALLKQQLCEYAWLSQSIKHHGSKQFKQSGKWTLAQQLPSSLCGIGIDVNERNPVATTVGDFSTLGSL